MSDISILGTDYQILIKDYGDEKSFEELGIYGFCDGYAKEIVVCNPYTYPIMEGDTRKTKHEWLCTLIRHEIVHAFLFESGLASNSSKADTWATNEEMVDWIARQGIKLCNAWKTAENEMTNIGDSDGKD